MRRRCSIAPHTRAHAHRSANGFGGLNPPQPPHPSAASALDAHPRRSVKAMREPSIPLVKLREYRSASGSTYLAGDLGKARVVMLRDERAECTGKEVARWAILLQPSQPRPSDAAPADRKAAASPSRRPKITAPGRDAAHAAAADRRAAAVMVDMGFNPRGPDPNDVLPF